MILSLLSFPSPLSARAGGGRRALQFGVPGAASHSAPPQTIGLTVDEAEDFGFHLVPPTKDEEEYSEGPCDPRGAYHVCLALAHALRPLHPSIPSASLLSLPGTDTSTEAESRSAADGRSHPASPRADDARSHPASPRGDDGGSPGASPRGQGAGNFLHIPRAVSKLQLLTPSANAEGRHLWSLS